MGQPRKLSRTGDKGNQVADSPPAYISSGYPKNSEMTFILNTTIHNYHRELLFAPSTFLEAPHRRLGIAIAAHGPQIL